MSIGGMVVLEARRAVLYTSGGGHGEIKRRRDVKFLPDMKQQQAELAFM
jgi:hypothetical protein